MRDEAAMLENCFTIRGDGGMRICIAVQERLQRDGLCSFTRWDPSPPYWRFFYETYLQRDEILRRLADLRERYSIDVR